MTLFSNMNPPLTQEALFQQMSILDLFLPGFTNITSTVSQVLNGNMSSYTRLVCIFAVLAFLRPHVFRLGSWFMEYFTTTIHVKRSEEAYDMLQCRISSHGLENAARSLLATIKTRQTTYGEHGNGTKKLLQYTPWEGGLYFWYNWSLLFYQSKLVDIGFHKEEQVSVTCFGRSPGTLKDFLEACRHEYLDQSKNKTMIYGHRFERWKKEKAVPSRPLSTIILDGAQKEPLIRDIRNFLDPQTKLWYAKRSIPYRRGYLLFGPPGTGKSSFSLSIAGELDLDIYVISIPSVHDQTLKDLFDGLPDRCVILLEDIDAAGATHSRDLQSEDSDSEGGTGPHKKAVTLSGLLNTLDGVASQEDRILIMTTNHVEKLDEALIRPGRVDFKVEFRLADRETAEQLFYFMLGHQEQGSLEGDHKGNSDVELEEQAAEFAAKVPDLKFSSAEIMSYLLQYRDCPAAAIENCGQWVDGLLKEKEAKEEAVKGCRKG